MEQIEGGSRWLRCGFALIGAGVAIAGIFGATFGVGAAIALSIAPSVVALGCS